MTSRRSRFSCALLSAALVSLVSVGCTDSEVAAAATDVTPDLGSVDSGDSDAPDGTPDSETPDTAIEPDVEDAGEASDTELIADTTPEPDTAEVDPDTAEVDPDSAEVDPDSAEVDPDSAEVDPDSAEVDPDSAEVDPDSAEVDPDSAEVDPDSAEVDPDSAEVDPDSAEVDPDVTDDDATTPCPNCATNNPCVESAAPSSNDDAINACVCAEDAYCCDTAWDAACAEFAQSKCGLVCDCKAGSDCETDADCAACGGNVCTGAWSCVAGGCAQAAPIVCVDDTPNDCLVTECGPSAGACVTYPDTDACDDGDPCTTDFCDAETGACESLPVLGCPGGDPCVVHAPGSTDAEVSACVCALDDYCCTTEWDETCIAMATGTCDHACSCEDATPVDLPCSEDSDCVACSADACAAPWACVAGTCTAGPAVVCDTSLDSECLRTECNPASGACELATGNAFCDDGEPCTTDLCVLESGACIHEDDPLCGQSCSEGQVPCKSDLDCAPCTNDLCLSAWECKSDVCTAKTIPPCVATGCDVASCDPSTGACTITPLPCGQNHPCVASSSFSTKDPAVAECVCALDDTCCLAAWDATCVSIAALACGVACDCQVAPADHPCTTDADCAYCGDTVCGAGFTCNTGVCGAPDDTCPNAPPYVCRGASQAAAMGCDTVDASEGCCDAWGRLVWCDGGNTFCIDCDASKIPSCGWSSPSGFYDCATDGAEESTGTFPIACGL